MKTGQEITMKDVNTLWCSHAAADMNGDGILDNGDIGPFVAAFLAGC